MSKEASFQEFVAAKAEELAVPGVAAGIFFKGEEHYAFHGVTSIENPLEVDEKTLFQFGSTGKTFTGTAVVQLVEQGKVELDVPVRTYVPELKLKDESVAEKVTVLQLLNHSAGWAGDFLESTGDGDDALARYVEKMADLDQVTPLGETVSYNNASLILAGRLIENVTGKTHELAMKEMIFEPLGLDMTFFFMNDIMTRRFAVGHNQKPDGTISIARPWAIPRSAAPAGGMSATAHDQIAWARFHLGDGRSSDGTRVLSEVLLKRMQETQIETPGNTVGDAVAITWWIRNMGGLRVIAHGGTTYGQHSAFEIVPDKEFAFISMTNCGPNGPQLNDEAFKWALNEYLGVEVKDPEPISLADEELRVFAGRYETIAAISHITPSSGGLELRVEIKPETLKQMRDAGEETPDEQEQTFVLGLLPGDGDLYIVTEGAAKGLKGYFVRNESGEIEAVHVGGRLATKIKDAVPA
ncbi:MAG: serine hydrolase domain-containing protein [Actinomycetota bacterium]